MVVFFAYGWNSVWSFLLTVEIWFGLFCLRWRIGLVFFTYGSPCLENWVWSFFTYGSPTVSKKDEP